MLETNSKEPKRSIRDWLREKKDQVTQFYQENKQWIVPVGIAFTGVALKQGTKYIAARKQENVKDKYWYDPSLGRYWKLRRRPDKDETLEIDRRHSNGERLGDIFDSMKLLK